MSRTVSKDDLTKAYRAKAKTSHPDKNGGKDAQFQLVNAPNQVIRRERGFA